LRASGKFGINVLGRGQADLATTFARKGKRKFDGVPWRHANGLPRLTSAPDWLACDVARIVSGGDHMVIFGTVVHAGHSERLPLTYCRRAFGTRANGLFLPLVIPATRLT
jgi:flavin reductase (DIM6/NTAB) family NADH-FMN oxidoreductase RutF